MCETHTVSQHKEKTWVFYKLQRSETLIQSKVLYRDLNDFKNTFLSEIAE